MLFPLHINDEPVDPSICQNNKWKETDYYLFSTKSEFFCSARLVSLDKQVTQVANEALIYLLERLIIEEEEWDEKETVSLETEHFGNFLLSSYFSFPECSELPTATFWKNYQEIITGMKQEKEFRLTNNRQPATDPGFLEERYLLSVHSYADAWNNQQYFVETWTHWCYYAWGTGA